MRGSLTLINTFCVLASVSAVTSNSLTYNLQYVGCYDVGYSLRESYHHHILGVTLTECASYCKILKTRYLGVEASDNFCYCGDDIPMESIQRNSTLCNVQCPDEPHKTCGGEWIISVYENPGESAVEINEDVDFLLGLSMGVRLYHSKDSSSKFDTLLNTGSEWIYTVDYHFSKNIIFAFTKKELYKATLDAKRSTPQELINIKSSCDGFAVDWEHDRIYWAKCKPNDTSIMAIGLDGEDERTLPSTTDISGKRVKRMNVDPYKGVIFLLLDGSIWSCGTVENSEEGFKPNLTKADLEVRDFALDIKRRKVYYVGTMNRTTSLYSMDYNGDEEVEHFSIHQIKSVYGLTILGDKVFWINYANVRDAIYEAPVNLVGTGGVKMIKTIDRAVWHMRVVHPSLQKRPMIDPCLDKGCAYSCESTWATSAKCKCPPGQTLQADGVSCHIVENQDHHSEGAGTFFISILLVVTVLLMTLVLVYVGNKYYTLLEGKLFGVHYSRTRGQEGEGRHGVSTTEYYTRDDNVNLI